LVAAASLAVLSLLAFAVNLVALCEIGQGAGTSTRPGAQTAATLAAKILGSGNLVGPYPGLCITIHRGHMLCPADRGHRRLSAPSGSLGRTLFEILYMDFREFPFHALRCIRNKERRERPRYRRMEAGMREAMDLLVGVANALR
jgi:hypothetical protein